LESKLAKKTKSQNSNSFSNFINQQIRFIIGKPESSKTRKLFGVFFVLPIYIGIIFAILGQVLSTSDENVTPNSSTETSQASPSSVPAAETRAKEPPIPREFLRPLIMKSFEQNQDKDWWNHITDIKESRLTDDSKISSWIYVKTDYTVASAQNLIDATNLCNSLITTLDRDGFTVWIMGTVTEGNLNLDNTITTRDKEIPISQGGSNKPGNEDWCVANNYFGDVIAEMRAQGWKSQYGEGRDESGNEVIVDQRKMFEGSGFQKSPIFFLNEPSSNKYTP
jgi:hypothetical protein